MKWEDLDFEAGTLTIRRALVEVKGRAVWSDPKTARGRRLISLDPSTVSALRAYRAHQAEERLSLGAAYRDERLVFCEADGSHIHPSRASKLFRRHRLELSVPAIRLHDLRHTYATLALRAGVHPKVVSERLGHANIAMTLDTYSHAVPGLQSEAALLIANLIDGQGEDGSQGSKP